MGRLGSLIIGSHISDSRMKPGSSRRNVERSRREESAKRSGDVRTRRGNAGKRRPGKQRSELLLLEEEAHHGGLVVEEVAWNCFNTESPR